MPYFKIVYHLNNPHTPEVPDVVEAETWRTAADAVADRVASGSTIRVETEKIVTVIPTAQIAKIEVTKGALKEDTTAREPAKS